MTIQEQAILDLARFLEGASVPYMVIGGIANAVWGEPRATLDVDVTVWVDEPAIPSLVERFARQFQLRVQDPVAFISQTRVLPLFHRDGTGIDVIFGLLSFEKEAIDRAVPITLANGSFRACTSEDLLLMKILSERPQDLKDAEAIARRRFAALDSTYLEPRLRELAALLERPEILARWKMWTARSVSEAD